MVDSVTGQGEDYAVIGRCGLYCGGCPVYLGGRGDEDAKSHAINEWNVPAEKIRCNGCQGLTPECFGNECILLPCLEGKGYMYCSECAESAEGSCDKFGRTSNYLEDLGESAEDNLKRVQAGKAQEWLKEQEKRWSCPDCGSPFFWEATRCPRCGKALE